MSYLTKKWREINQLEKFRQELQKMSNDAAKARAEAERIERIRAEQIKAEQKAELDSLEYIDGIRQHYTIYDYDRPSNVYAIRTNHGSCPCCGAQLADYMKIGWTTLNPKVRFESHQVSNPTPLTLIGITEGDRKHEKYLHWKLSHAKAPANNEWFKYDEAFIREHFNALIHYMKPLPEDLDLDI